MSSVKSIVKSQSLLPAHFSAYLSTISVSLSSIDKDVAFLAGERWKVYRKSGEKRKRIITYFLIGAHAMIKAERFFTRDRGFYKSYFSELKILSL